MSDQEPLAGEEYSDANRLPPKVIEFRNPETGRLELYDSAFTDEQIEDAIYNCERRFGCESAPKAIAPAERTASDSRTPSIPMDELMNFLKDYYRKHHKD